MKWTPEEVDKITNWFKTHECGNYNLEELAKQTNRTVTAIYHKPVQLRITKSIYWTHKEVELLKECYSQPCKTKNGTLHLKSLAKKLNKSTTAISRKAAYMGIARPKVRIDTYRDKIIDLYNKNLSICQISKKLRIAERCVRMLLIRNGFQTNRTFQPTHESQIKRNRAFKKWLQDKGFSSLRDITLHRMLDDSRKRWSAARTPSQCNILDILEQGPSTVMDIADKLNLSWSRVKFVLGQLSRLGLVSNTKSEEIREGSRGTRPRVWHITTTRQPAAIPL